MGQQFPTTARLTTRMEIIKQHLQLGLYPRGLPYSMKTLVLLWDNNNSRAGRLLPGFDGEPVKPRDSQFVLPGLITDECAAMAPYGHGRLRSGAERCSLSGLR